MQINNNGINTTTNSSQNSQKTSSSSKTDGNSSAPANSSDNIELSPEARNLTELESKIIASADVDVKRVEEIKQAISDGTYKIDADSIATKMLSNDDIF